MKNNQGFIKHASGVYSLAKKSVTEEQIIKQASKLLYKELKRKKITSSRDAKAFFEHELGLEEREHLGVLYLDASHGVIDFKIEFSGTVDASAVYPRHILQQALSLGICNACIIVHNHPSNSLEVSKADIEISKRVRDVLLLCDIRLLDSLIVSREGSVSLSERGLL